MGGAPGCRYAADVWPRVCRRAAPPRALSISAAAAEAPFDRAKPRAARSPRTVRTCHSLCGGACRFQTHGKGINRYEDHLVLRRLTYRIQMDLFRFNKKMRPLGDNQGGRGSSDRPARGKPLPIPQGSVGLARYAKLLGNERANVARLIAFLWWIKRRSAHENPMGR